ncbi:MAG TPA: YciI-like protein [Terriglobales bacterium]|jgi:uncharacterized protein YciI/heme-degrading monooxygenase HmoA|nr:YciI-like protein [Terriglobales bacterium]
MHYLLFYEVADDYLARRAEFRDAHLEKAWKASERGELVLGGALQDPVDGAVLLFKGGSPEVAEKFARVDPYVTSGLVKRWYVREWKTVAGEDSAAPVRPNARTAGTVAASAITPGTTILRMWKARATVEKSGEYVDFVTTKLFRSLSAIDGHRGAYLLRREVDGAIEFVVLTLWESMEAVQRFAGSKPERAVVEPEARAVLANYDDLVTHFEVVDRPNGTNTAR